MLRFLSLIANEHRMQIYEMKQYWFETVGTLLIMTVMFLGLFYGIKGFVPGADEAGSLDGLMFGYIMFWFCSSAYGSVPSTLGEYTQTGFLEQLYMSPDGFMKILAAKLIVVLYLAAIGTILLAYLAMWLSGNWIDLNFFLLFALLAITIPSIVGLGFILGGFTLVYKRIGVLTSMASIAVIALVAFPGLPLQATSFLPLAPGATLARITILQGQSISLENLIIVLLNSVIYLALGLAVYKFMERRAKRRNLIGQY